MPPVTEAGERYIRVLAIFHRAVDVIDAVNFGVPVLKRIGRSRYSFSSGLSVSGSASRVKRLITGAAVQPEVFSLKRQIG
jgi:hypothetical protein